MSRRNRTSWRLPRLITPKLLDELHPIAVGIEDVQQPHFVVDLEHGADLDVLGAKALCLGLRVFDVERRDAGLLGLAFSKGDLHGAPFELCPPAALVEVRLGEAQLVGVEAASRLEVANEVPDPHSARAPARALPETSARCPGTPLPPSRRARGDRRSTSGSSSALCRTRRRRRPAFSLSHRLRGTRP